MNSVQQKNIKDYLEKSKWSAAKRSLPFKLDMARNDLSDACDRIYKAWEIVLKYDLMPPEFGKLIGAAWAEIRNLESILSTFEKVIENGQCSQQSVPTSGPNDFEKRLK